jgi:hypothetical protein
MTIYMVPYYDRLSPCRIRRKKTIVYCLSTRRPYTDSIIIDLGIYEEKLREWIDHVQSYTNMKSYELIVGFIHIVLFAIFNGFGNEEISG